MDIFRTIQNNMIKIRKERRLAQLKVGNIAGLADGHYGKIEHGGIKNIQVNTLDKIAKALHVEPFLLLVEDYEVAKYLDECHKILITLSTSEREELLRQIQAAAKQKKIIGTTTAGYSCVEYPASFSDKENKIKRRHLRFCGMAALDFVFEWTQGDRIPK